MTVAQHTHHAENSAGSQCIACHMPRIEATLPGEFVAAHTFRFISPKESETLGIPREPLIKSRLVKGTASAVP